MTGLKSPGEKLPPAATDADAVEADAIPDAAVAKPAVAVADAWWNWWADYTETYRPQKQISSTTYGDGSYANNSQLLSMYSTTATRGPGSGAAAFAECFVAGTPVATISGPVAIEKLQIGDRVLSQNAQTGELAFKAVLGATIRPPVETVLVTTSRRHPLDPRPSVLDRRQGVADRAGTRRRRSPALPARERDCHGHQGPAE